MRLSSRYFDHKTRVPRWEAMKQKNDRMLRCQNKDIHLVPVQFLFYDPEMLRNYGGRVLMFNMNNPDTRDAFSSAMETPMDT